MTFLKEEWQGSPVVGRVPDEKRAEIH